MPSVSLSTWMSEVIARHPQNQHLHNNLHVMKGMYNLLLKSNLKLASPGPDCILACWYVSILNLHNSIGIVFTCHGRGIAQFIMAEFPTQHPAHTQGCTQGSRKGIHSLLSTCDFGALVWTWCSLHWTAGASCLVRQPVVVKGLGRSASIDAVGGGAGSGW